MLTASYLKGAALILVGKTFDACFPQTADCQLVNASGRQWAGKVTRRKQANSTIRTQLLGGIAVLGAGRLRRNHFVAVLQPAMRSMRLACRGGVHWRLLASSPDVQLAWISPPGGVGLQRTMD